MCNLAFRKCTGYWVPRVLRRCCARMRSTRGNDRQPLINNETGEDDVDAAFERHQQQQESGATQNEPEQEQQPREQQVAGNEPEIVPVATESQPEASGSGTLKSFAVIEIII